MLMDAIQLQENIHQIQLENVYMQIFKIFLYKIIRQSILISLYSKLMKAKQSESHIIPPCPKTTRGEPSFLQSSSTHLLYFNGCTVILRPYDNTSILFINHNCLVTAAKFSYNDKLIASIDQKGTLMIHQLQTNKLVLYKFYQGFYMGGKSIDWTSDNKRICVVGSGKNKFGRVISVDTGTDVGEISAVTSNLTTVSFRPQRPYKLAVGGQQFTAKFYQGPPFKFVSSKKSHINYINQIKYSPNGKFLVSVGSDRKIVLYDGLTFQILKQLENAHGGGIMGVVWLNNQTFFTGSSDKKIKKWNISLQVIAQIDSTSEKSQLALIDSFVVAISYSIQKQKIYFVLLSGQIKETDQNLTKITNKFDGCKNKIIKIIPIEQKDSAVAIDSNGKLLKINTKNNEIHRYLHNTLSNNKLFTDGCLSPTGIIYYLTGDQQVYTAHLHKQQQSQPVKVQGAKFILNINTTKINGFVCLFQNYVKIYSEKQGKYEKSAEIKIQNDPTYVFNSVQIVEESDLIWVGSLKGIVEVFRLNHSSGQFKLEKLTQLKTNNNKITYIQTYNDLVFTGDSMGSIKVWRWSRNQKNLQKVSDSMGSHTSMITSILVYKDHIYTFSMDNKASIWKLQNFLRINTSTDVHKHGIICASIIGQKVVSSGGDLLTKVLEF